MTEAKKLFIIGSGFSRAFSNEMPTIRDLSRFIRARETMEQLPVYNGNLAIYARLAKEPEELLTYLAQASPWKSPEEVAIDRAAFTTLSRRITQFLMECETRAFQQPNPPAWADQFVTYLHKTNATVVSLNYDTVLERLSRKLRVMGRKGIEPVQTWNLYRMPLCHPIERTNSVWNVTHQDTYRLLKLHGSINWYVAPDEQGGQEVYFIPTTTDSPLEDHDNGHDERMAINTMDLVPLIIPHVADKAQFYKPNLVKTLWGAFRQALEAAEEIYIIGYSLPRTDLTMRLFLTAAANSTANKAVYLVNSADGRAADPIIDRYKTAMPASNWEDRSHHYLGENAVHRMVEELVRGM